jgi:nitroreductase
MDENKIPKMNEQYSCFSCFNCMVVCPVDAVSIVEVYHVEEGFFDIQYPPIKMPREPRDAEGNPDEWTAIERTVLERRSVRNFKEDPVPEPLIRRVLEAGRFTPSAGNHQPWRFTVVTDQAFIREMGEACHSVLQGISNTYHDNEGVMSLVGNLPTGAFDPRVQGGFRCVATKALPVFLNAPAVIFIGCNEKMASPEEHAGICGQNMSLVAKSLGLGSCWNNFGATVDFIPDIKSRLGYDDTWRIYSTLCLGYPQFRQEGMVPRQCRPVTWFRPDTDGPQVEE